MHIFIDVRLLGRGAQSGIEEYTFQAVDHLLHAGGEHRFTLFYSGVRKKPLPAPWRSFTGPKEWTRRTNVRVIDWRVPNRILDALAHLFKWPDIPARVGADIVFSPHFNILATRVPRVITFHDLSFLRYPRFFSARQRLWHWMQRYRAQAAGAAAIVVNSQFSASDVHGLLGVPREKIHLIYPGINPLFKPIAPNDAQLAQFKDRHRIAFPYLLALGTIEPRKNIPLVVRAFTALKRDPRHASLRLIIAGRRGWLYGESERAIARSPARDHIIRWGAVDPDDRRLLYTGSSAFVYPSFFEGFGFPPLEAQACGAPVVVSDRTSLPEVVGASALRVSPWSVDELAGAIERILTDNRARDALIAAGYQNVKRFSWETNAQELLTLFHATL